MRALLVRDYHGQTRGGPTGYYAISDYAWSVSYCTLCSASPATQASMGDCGPWGGAGEELLGTTPYGAAGRRPNRGCRPRAAAGAARHNVTKLHRPWTYLDAGRWWASRAASRRMCQAGASTSRCPWSRTRKESRAARGPEEQVPFWGTYHADVGHGGANSFTPQVICTDCHQATIISPLAEAAEWDVR